MRITTIPIALLAAAGLFTVTSWSTLFGERVGATPFGESLDPADRSLEPSDRTDEKEHARLFATGWKTLVNVSDLQYMSWAFDPASSSIVFEWQQDLVEVVPDEQSDFITANGGQVTPETSYTSRLVAKTSLHPTSLDARDMTEVFVAGHPIVQGDPDTSISVIEVWGLEYEKGHAVLTRPALTSLPGNSEAHTLPSLGILAPPFEYFGSKDVVEKSRGVVFTGASMGTVIAIEVDPSRRYMLCLNDSGELYQLSLLLRQPPVKLANIASAPSLSGASEITLLQHSIGGRIAVVSRGWAGDASTDAFGGQGLQSRSVFVDANNDAIFESIQNLADGQWGNSAYADAQLIIERIEQHLFCKSERARDQQGSMVR